MNREIKFRSFVKYTKEIFEAGKIDIQHKRVYERNYPSSYYLLDDIELMQFTGLHDKNGKEIYEGDILKFSDVDTAIVQWDKEYASFIAKPVEDFYFDNDVLGFAMGNNSAVEVIGNIYENPELLGGE